jgi:serine/threonine protein kinase
LVIKQYHKKSNRFFRPYIIHEIEIHARLQHDHIVSLYGVFETEDSIYLIMESCITDLRDYMNDLMNKGNFPLRPRYFIKDVAIPILRGLIYLHGNHIVHRDIKPENVLLDVFGRWKICDFGVSMDLLTQRSASIVGTLDYMSPEVANHNILYTDCEKLDIWSFGIMACECLTGIVMFELNENTKFALYAKTDELSTNIDLNIPKLLTGIQRNFVECCLQVSREQRWAARELLQHPFLQEKPPDTETFLNPFRCKKPTTTGSPLENDSGTENELKLNSSTGTSSGSDNTKSKMSIRSFFKRNRRIYNTDQT